MISYRVACDQDTACMSHLQQSEWAAGQKRDTAGLSTLAKACFKQF